MIPTVKLFRGEMICVFDLIFKGVQRLLQQRAHAASENVARSGQREAHVQGDDVHYQSGAGSDAAGVDGNWARSGRCLQWRFRQSEANIEN